MKTFVTGIAMALAVTTAPISALAEGASCNGAKANTAEMKAEKSDVTAVFVRADWCSSCKVMDPRVSKVMADPTFRNVNFIALDYTDRNKDAFWAAAAKAGVGDALKATENGKIKTGVFYIIDTKASQSLARLNKKNDETELRTALTDISSEAVS